MLSIIATMPENSEDRQFISQLYEEYEGLLYATALKYTTYHLDAEEIVQDSLVRLIKKVSVIRKLERCVLAGYLVSTVRNTAINYIQKEQSRQKRRDVFEQGVVAETPAQELSLDELMILSENRQRIKDAWRKLAEGDRFLLEGKYFLGLTDAELAHQMNCKPESISFCWEQSHLAWQRILVNLVF